MYSDSLFRSLSAFLLVITFFLLLGVNIFATKRQSDRQIGIVLEDGTEQLIISSVMPNLPAARGGLQAKDQILAVEGQPVAAWSDYDRLAQDFQPGLTYDFRVLRDGRELTLVLAPGGKFPWASFLLGTVVAFAYLGLGLLTLAQPEQDVRTCLLVTLSSAACLELALPLGGLGAPWPDAALNLARYLLVGLQIPIQLHLASRIPELHPWVARRPWMVPLFYGFGTVFVAAMWWTVVAEAGLGWAPPWDPGTASFAAESLVTPAWTMVAVALLLYQALRYPEPQGRHQAGLVLAGLVPWAVLIWFWSGLDVLSVSAPGWIISAQPVTLLCFPVAVFVAIFRYHLFDIELVTRRGLVYTVLTSVLLLVFYGVVGAGGTLIASLGFDPRASVWLTGAATLLLGLLFSPLLQLVKHQIDLRFFPERVALRQELSDLAAELPSQGRVPLMANHLVHRLGDIFRLRSATLLLADPKTGLLITSASTRVDFESDFEQTFLLSPHDPGVQLLRDTGRPLPAAQLVSESAALAQRLQVFESALAVPLLSHDRLVGVLLLGAKRRGELFVAEELDLLKLVAHHVASTFENVRLYESVTVESLTGLLRREAILEQLDRELQRAQRYRRPLTVALADLDHFKQVNDRYGHLVGDALLRRVSQVLSADLRSADFIGRYGGEEFLLVMPETSLSQAVWVAEKLRRRVQAMSLGLDDGSRLSVTLSIGLATLADPSLPEKASNRDLISLADGFLYLAKDRGRNRIEPVVAPTEDSQPLPRLADLSS